MEEVFLPVPVEGFSEYYSISNKGRVRVDVISKYSSNKTEFLALHPSPRGYLFCAMTRNGKTVQKFIHRMVAEAFCSKENPDYNVVCHMDDNKLNNDCNNLVWGTHQINMDHMVQRGRSLKGEKNPRAKINKEKADKIRELYKNQKISQQKLGDIFGINQTQVSRIILNKLW